METQRSRSDLSLRRCWQDSALPPSLWLVMIRPTSGGRARRYLPLPPQLPCSSAVQLGYNARQYLWSAAEVREWWPDMVDNSDRETILREEQALAFARWNIWTTWMRITYNLGILALLSGLALALPPQRDTDVQSGWRWAAVGLVFAGCAAEACWIFSGFWRRFWEDRKIRKVT